LDTKINIYRNGSGQARGLKENLEVVNNLIEARAHFPFHKIITTRNGMESLLLITLGLLMTGILAFGSRS